jgi:CheY-like chemotaxis protein
MKSRKGLNVLVVEDQAADAMALRILLDPDGHRVRVVSDGEAALLAAIEDPPDVMLLDLGLPKLNGFEVAAATRSVAWGRRPLLVAVTGHADDAHRSQALKAGIDLYMTKPVDPDALRTTLEVYQTAGREAARRTSEWQSGP